MKCCHAVGRGIHSLGEFGRRAANKVHDGDMGDACRILAVERKATRHTFRDEVWVRNKVFMAKTTNIQEL